MKNLIKKGIKKMKQRYILKLQHNRYFFKMGQSQVQLKQNENYHVIEELPVGSIVQYNQTQTLLFLKEYSFTAQQAYQKALNSYSLKLVNKNQHVLNFMQFTTKSQTSFCSTFHKIALIFQYIDYSLEKQVRNRTTDNLPFNEKQMWSVLCSCVLASVYLIQCEGKMHCGLTSKDIRLSNSGCVKLLSHEMIGMDHYHSQAQGQPKTLALTLIECFQLQKLSNSQNSYLQKVIENLQCSQDMKNLLLMMITQNLKFTQLQQYLFKLVQDDESLASQSNTPILKSKSSLNSHKKQPKRGRDQSSLKHSKASDRNCIEIQPNLCDLQDTKSNLCAIQLPQTETQNPDEIQYDGNDQTDGDNEQPDDNFCLREHNHQINIQTFYSIPKSSKQQSEQLQTKQYKINKLSLSGTTQNILLTQSNQNLKPNNTINIPSINQTTQQHLYTDPKLLSWIKNDLQVIKKLKKNKQLKEQSLNDNPQNFTQNITPPITLPSNSTPTPQHHPTQTSRSSHKKSSTINNIKIQNHSKIDESRNIQISKDLNKQRSSEKKNNTNIIKQENKQQINIIQHTQKIIPYAMIEHNSSYNILDDSQNVFKKKKQFTAKFQTPKQNTCDDHNSANQKLITHNNTNRSEPQQNLQNKSKSSNSNIKSSSQNTSNHKPQQLLGRFSESSNCSVASSNHKGQEGKQEENLVNVSETYNRGRYEGTKLNGKRHGYGTFYYSQGGKYVGNWKYNKMHGKGILYYPNNQIAYDGEWKNDQLSGFGTLFNEQVAQLETPLDYHDLNDVEDYWLKYEGNFYQDNKQGHGKLYLVNGQNFQGEFHDDKVEGEGVFDQGNGKQVKGKWSQNKLIKLL